MIPGPLLLLVGPFVPATIAYLISRWARLTGLIGALLIGVWIAMVAVLPLDAPRLVQETSLFAGDQYWALGRPLVLSPGVRLLILGVATGMALLSLLSAVWPQGNSFVPAMIGMLSPLSALLMTRALTPAMLAIVPIAAMATWQLQTGHTTPTQRQTPLLQLAVFLFATGALLIVGWTIDTGEAAFAGAAWRLLALGCLILLAGFPFHWWVFPLLTETRELVAALVLSLLQLVIAVFLADLIADNAWLVAYTPLPGVLRVAGQASIGVAGLLAAAAWLRPTVAWPHVLAWLLLIDMGVTLLILGQPEAPVLALLVAQHLARFWGLLIAGCGVRLTTDSSADAWGHLPAAYGALSLIGLPLTPGFAPRLAALQAIGGASLWAVVPTVLAGLVGLTLVGRLLWQQRGRLRNLRAQANSAEAAFVIGALLLSLIPALFGGPLVRYAEQIARLFAG